MNTLTVFLKWVTNLASEYGPILVAINAIWSLYHKVRGILVGKKPTQGRN